MDLTAAARGIGNPMPLDFHDGLAEGVGAAIWSAFDGPSRRRSPVRGFSDNMAASFWPDSGGGGGGGLYRASKSG
ncbi:hypothetical protein QYE76_014174 [Lolium multiflorum]|uniref:Uncharacterized protein n=1 Tax=Lolium multiflorum TaxID=4521 RepID=A0AAD8U2I5_LOLMU|nr:hypothetical protein QYE76_014174 [Lolium multiflorum]